MTCVIAIDAGTTGIRSRAVFVDGRPGVSRRTASSPSTSRSPGWVEHDADEIWDAVAGDARRRRRRGSARRRSPRSASPTSARRSSPGTARPGGRTARAIVWQDRRTAARCDELAAAGAPRPRPPAHRARARPVLQRHQVRVAAARRRRPGRRRPGARHDRRLADLEPHRRRGARHRPDQRQPHDAVRHRARWRGTTSCATCSTSRSTGLPDVVPVERTVRRDVRPLRRARPASRSAASPATSRRRCSARRASSPGWPRTRTAPGSFVLLNVGADAARRRPRAC